MHFCVSVKLTGGLLTPCLCFIQLYHIALRPQKRGCLLGIETGGGDERVKAWPWLPPEKDWRDHGPPPEQWKAVSPCHCTASSALCNCCFNCCAGQSHKDNCCWGTTRSERSPAFAAQHHLPAHDLFWANLRLQLHLPPLDLTWNLVNKCVKCFIRLILLIFVFYIQMAMSSAHELTSARFDFHFILWALFYIMIVYIFTCIHFFLNWNCIQIITFASVSDHT